MCSRRLNSSSAWSMICQLSEGGALFRKRPRAPASSRRCRELAGLCHIVAVGAIAPIERRAELALVVFASIMHPVWLRLRLLSFILWMSLMMTALGLLTPDAYCLPV